jgi:hypothetical protein
MSFVSTGGITKLSQLTIDADKNWNLKGISIIKELALAMVRGDLLVHDGVRIVRLPATVANLVLTSTGPLSIPAWLPGGLYLNRYIPASIFLTDAEAKNTVRTHTHNNPNSPITSTHVETYGDLPASMVKELRPTITVPVAAAKNTARTYLQALTPAIHSHFDLQTVVQGAFRSPLGIDADETAAAQSAAANDMSLPPQTPLATDAYKFGHPVQFDVLRLNVGTAGVGVWTVTWKYWNGAWVALAGITDGTNGFHNAGFNEVTFTRPGDWAVQNLGGLGNQYYIEAEITAYTSRVTQPLGTQAFIRIIT